MVKTGGEEVFKTDAKKNLQSFDPSIQFYFFKRTVKLSGKKRGLTEIKPMFPGYVFMESRFMDAYLLERIKECKNFYHFLPKNGTAYPLEGKDLQYLQKLLSYGEVASISKATFDKDDRIVILSGPLQGFKGNIIRVDKRKQRVSIRLDMCGSVSSIDLSYELVSKEVPA